MRKVSLVLSLMAVIAFGTFVVEGVSAQNSNTNTTMQGNDMKHGMGRRHHRRHARRHMRRHRMMRRANKNANQ